MGRYYECTCGVQFGYFTYELLKRTNNPLMVKWTHNVMRDWQHHSNLYRADTFEPEQYTIILLSKDDTQKTMTVPYHLYYTGRILIPREPEPPTYYGDDDSRLPYVYTEPIEYRMDLNNPLIWKER